MEVAYDRDVEYGLAVAALLSAILSFRALRRELCVSWDSVSWAIVTVGVVFSLPTLAAKLTSSFTYRYDDNGLLVTASIGWAQQLYRLGDLVLAGVSFALLARAATGKRPLTLALMPGALVSLILLAWTVTALTRAEGWPQFQPLLLVLAILGVALNASTRKAVCNAVLVLFTIVNLAGAAVTIVRPDLATQACGDKCTFAGEIYSGPASHANGLGLIMVAALPFVWAAVCGRTRAFLAANILLVVALTGSRTSLAAAAGIVLVLIISEHASSVANAWRVAAAAALALALASLTLPLIETGSQFATGRGGLWMLARHQIGEHLLVGDGITAWAEQFESGAFGAAAAYSTHSQWLEALLMAGLIGAGLLALVYLSMIFSGEPRERLASTIALLPLLALSLLERPLSFTFGDPMSWYALALAAIASMARNHQASSRSTLPTHSRSTVHVGAATATVETQRQQGIGPSEAQLTEGANGM